MNFRYGIAGMLFLILGSSLGRAQMPPAPTNLVAMVSFGEEVPAILLSWQSATSSDEGSFKVYRSVDDTTHFQFRSWAGERSFSDRDVIAGHVYYYYVTLVVGSMGMQMESGPSNTASAALGSGSGRPHGTISGTVTDSITGKPLRMIRISFFRISSGEDWDPEVWTDSLGHYTALLDTGTYLIRAKSGWNDFEFPPLLPPVILYQTEWFDDAADPEHATPVAVADSSKSVADFDLKPFVPPHLAMVTGTVTDTNGKPLGHATVVFTRTMRDMEDFEKDDEGMWQNDFDIDGFGHWRGGFWRGLTDSLGHYTAQVLSGRTYIAFAFAKGYLPQFYKHESDPRHADPITVNGDTSGINFSLIPKPVFTNTVSGAVRDSVGDGVLSRVLLIPVGGDPDEEGAQFVLTDTAGLFTFTGVAPGKYFVLALPFGHFAPAFFKAGACGVIRWQSADTVSVTGNVAGIDICVEPFEGGGMADLSGMVESGGMPLAGVNVFALNSSGGAVGYGVTDASGQYTLTLIPPGQITVLADEKTYQYATLQVGVGPAQTSVGGLNLSLASMVTTVSPPRSLPAAFSLEQNYPNPFNPSTHINYTLPAVSNIRLVVYNLLGQEIAVLAQGTQSAGVYHIVWGGKDQTGKAVSSGVYFYRLVAFAVDGSQNVSTVRRMVVLK